METDNFYIHSYIKISCGSIWHNGRCIVEGLPDTAAVINYLLSHTQLQYMKFYKMDLMSKMGILSAVSILPAEAVHPTIAYKQGILLQNRHASLHTDRLYQDTLNTIASPALFVYTLPNIVMGEIAIKYGWKGENTFQVSDTFDIKHLYSYARILCKHNILDTLLCGWIDVNDQEQDICIYWATRTPGSIVLDENNLETIYSSGHA